MDTCCNCHRVVYSDFSRRFRTVKTERKQFGVTIHIGDLAGGPDEKLCSHCEHILIHAALEGDGV